MIRKVKLKRCPFCKGEGKIEEQTECLGHGDYITFHYVRCLECGARGRRCSDKDYGICNIVMAVDYWNKRKLLNLKPKFYPKVIFSGHLGKGKTLSLLERMELESKFSNETKNKTQ
ncbi:MAG: Lar family restriction alleviation protein [Lachnospiraceae bacterium]|nr:Lar family restriction alleviation protein [Lachnospiraceae bacterium]